MLPKSYILHVSLHDMRGGGETDASAFLLCKVGLPPSARSDAKLQPNTSPSLPLTMHYLCCSLTKPLISSPVKLSLQVEL